VRLRFRPARLRLPRGAESPRSLKGRLRRVVVIKPEDERFVEAIFILRDDYLSDSEADAAALLAEAREAAGICAGKLCPPRRFPLWPFPAAAALAAAAWLLWRFLF